MKKYLLTFVPKDKEGTNTYNIIGLYSNNRKANKAINLFKKEHPEEKGGTFYIGKIDENKTYV